MKLLVLLSRVPYPLEKGDKLRAFNQIKELSRKHQIVLFALNDTKLDDKALAELKKYCVAISIVRFSKFTIFFNSRYRLTILVFIPEFTPPFFKYEYLFDGFILLLQVPISVVSFFTESASGFFFFKQSEIEITKSLLICP